MVIIKQPKVVKARRSFFRLRGGHAAFSFGMQLDHIEGETKKAQRPNVIQWHFGIDDIRETTGRKPPIPHPLEAENTNQVNSKSHHSSSCQLDVKKIRSKNSLSCAKPDHVQKCFVFRT